ncbi:MAG TPA: hypothetical protein EYH24_04550 [Thermococcus paralvinellae]|uniref:Uncharacterized protein n=1 Tax=Thermococcus paralvinellae TaxID=582419 RepID=A0A832ZD64_9EURY|nr:hypothetical protein [Thermococcus paralvinellae]
MISVLSVLLWCSHDYNGRVSYYQEKTRTWGGDGNTHGMFLLLLLLSLGIEFYYLLNAQLKNATLFLITPLFVDVKFVMVYSQNS